MNAPKITLVLVLVYFTVNSAEGQGACCGSKFTTSQKAFLRKMLQDEAKGLKAGMMHAFSTPRVKWFSLSTKAVCFGARDNQFGSFNVKDEGFLSAIKLVHVSGSVTCDKSTCAKTPAQFDSKWGCATSHPFLGKTSLNTLVTTATNKIVFPKDLHFTHDHDNLWYSMEQFDSDSNILVFQRFHEPLYIASGQELRLWYGEDLRDVSEQDNSGLTCANVFGFYL
ncbi:hypothetical protein QZH41_010485 [Actinostola sp. cb2023]|nr:hypothetical protein QZH41_010485 [Actinostola sp. cb2023]